MTQFIQVEKATLITSTSFLDGTQETSLYECTGKGCYQQRFWLSAEVDVLVKQLNAIYAAGYEAGKNHRE